MRFLQGVEKVEHVPYSSGDQFWVRFNEPLDFEKLQEVVKKHGYNMVRFAGLPSKLPAKLAEVLWDGVNFVIGKNISGFAKFTSSLGIEPDGIAKIATDLHGPYQIFIATDEAGIQLLYDYLGVKYIAPAPPPPKPAVPAAAKPAPVPVVQKPVTQPTVSPAAKPATPPQSQDVKTIPAAASPGLTVPAQQPAAQLPQSTVPKPPSVQPATETKPVPQPQPATTPVQVKTADQQTPLKKDESKQTTSQS